MLDWLSAHASILLFVNLSCGIAGVPVLSESLLLMSGALVAHGDRSFVEPFLAAVAGSVIGMTMSYAIGRAGQGATARWAAAPPRGSRSPRSPLSNDARMRRFDAVRERCRRFAPPMIVCSYFTPGLRHLTAMAIGASDAGARRFVPGALAGACAWSGLLLWTGMTAGNPAAAMTLTRMWYVPLAWAAALACGIWMMRSTSPRTPTPPRLPERPETRPA